MELKNGYKVLYEVIDGNTRTFYADKRDGSDVTTVGAFNIGDYKLVYEIGGKIYGSKTGIPAENDDRFDAFDKVFICDHIDNDNNEICDECKEEIPVAAYTRRSRKSAPVVEEPVAEEPEVTPVEE